MLTKLTFSFTVCNDKLKWLNFKYQFKGYAAFGAYDSTKMRRVLLLIPGGTQENTGTQTSTTLQKFYIWLVANPGLNLENVNLESMLLTTTLCSFLMILDLLLMVA